MIFTSITDVSDEDTVISLPSGWTYLDSGMESSMAQELFDGTSYLGSLYNERLTEVFVTEGLLLW